MGACVQLQKYRFGQSQDSDTISCTPVDKSGRREPPHPGRHSAEVMISIMNNYAEVVKRQNIYRVGDTLPFCGIAMM